MSPTWKAAIGVIVVFILGWFGGALTTLIIAHHKIIEPGPGQFPGPDHPAGTADDARPCQLDEGQKAKLHDLLLENVRERKELQKQIQPQVWKVQSRDDGRDQHRAHCPSSGKNSRTISCSSRRASGATRSTPGRKTARPLRRRKRRVRPPTPQRPIIRHRNGTHFSSSAGG